MLENSKKPMGLNELGTYFEHSHMRFGYTGATVMGGVVLAWKCISPTSYLGYIGSTIAGIAGATVIHNIVSGTHRKLIKWSHRTTAPIFMPSKFHNNIPFAIAFEKIKQHPDYPLFKSLMRYDNDEHVSQFFMKLLSGGSCFGSAIAILKAIEKSSHGSCQEILSSVLVEDILYYQLLHIMTASYQVKEVILRKKAWIKDSIQKLAKNNLQIASRENEFNPFSKIYPENNNEDCDLIATGKHLQRICSSLQNELFSRNEIESPSFSVYEASSIFQAHLEKLIYTCALTKDAKSIWGRIVVQGSEKVRSEGDPGHCLAFQCQNELFRYYDAIDYFSGGFFEYSHKAHFYEALKQQILGDVKHLAWDEVLVKFTLYASADSLFS